MKLKILVCIILLIVTISGNAQIKVNSSGKTVIGPVTTWADYILNITGSGESGPDGKIGFGDNSTSTKNVIIGEYGTTDTDQLLLHGDNGIHFSTTESYSTKMFLNESGNVGINAINPEAKLDVRGDAIFNNDGEDKDFRIESNNDTSLFFIDGGTDRIGIGTINPQAKLDVRGDAIFNNDGEDKDFRIENIYTPNGFFMDGGSDRVGIGTNTPNHVLSTRGTSLSMNNVLEGRNWNGGDKRLFMFSTSNNYPYLQMYYTDGSTVLVKINTNGYTYFNGGYVGIGVADPAYKLDVNGDIQCVDLHETSDEKYKENISDIENALDKLLLLRGITYEYKQDEKRNFPEGRRYGLVAQEVKEVIPELVRFNEYKAPENKNQIYTQIDSISRDSVSVVIEPDNHIFTSEENSYSLNYIGIIPLLIEAIKDQQSLIEDIQKKLDSLKSENNLKSAQTSSDDISYKAGDVPVLYQNLPNPFDENTEIRFYLPERITNAKLFLYDMQGIQIKNFIINQRGYCSEIVHGTELHPGMYMYTLIVNGREVDTKKMILTE